MSPTEGVIGEAWALYKGHWRHLLTLSFVVYLIVAVINGVLAATLTWLGALIGVVISLVAFFWLQGALVKAVDDVRDGRADLSFEQTFAAAREHLGAIAVAAILAGLAITVGLILLVVPGLFLMTIWAVVIPVVVLENRSAGESFTRSRELVRGHAWGVFGVIVLVILLLIGFEIVLGIVLLPLADWLRGFVSNVVSGTLTAPFTTSVLTLLYFRLRAAKEPATPSVPAAPEPQTE
jgi:hypothetical protein